MQIYRLSYCLDDDYPTINWDRHSSMADVWLEVDELHKENQPVDELLAKISYRCRLTDRWPQIDCYSMVPGIAVSERARGVFEEMRIPGMRFLEFCINKEPFFLFFSERRIDCLDRARSEIEFFPHDKSRVMQVLQYAFLEDRIQSCDVFTVPELSDGMFFWSQETFVTESARDAIDRSDLVGFRFADLPGQVRG